MQDSLTAALVKQLIGMNADRIIAARVSSDTKTRLRALAEHQQVSESALLKRLTEMALQGAGQLGATGEPRRRVVLTARLCIRLRTEDRLLLQERAAGRGMASATYVSILVRAHLRGLAPIPKDELAAMKRSVAELGAIGRNLNQIATSANRGGQIAGPLRDDLGAYIKVCAALRDHIKRLVRANLTSWDIGHAEAEG